MTAHDKTRLIGKVANGYYADPKGSVLFIESRSFYRAALLVNTNFILIENKL